MRNLVVAASLLSISAPGMAAVYVAEIQGTVTQNVANWAADASTTSPIRIGDTITASFRYMSPDSASESMLNALYGATRATFDLAGYRWTSDGDFLDELNPPPAFTETGDPLRDYSATMDDAAGAGDLQISGYTFEIGEFGYDLYTGPGFKGVFDTSTLAIWRDGARVRESQRFTARPVAAVPEPASWALMIAGFGLMGYQVRRARRASPTIAAA